MRLVILGSGGYGHTVADIAAQLGYETTFLDDRLLGFELSTFPAYIPHTSSQSTNTSKEVNKNEKDEPEKEYESVEFIPAFGNNVFRLEWINRLSSAGAKLATLIHPTAYISPTAVIKEATVILPKALINTDVTVEKGCIVNLGAIVDHGCVIEEGCHICLGAIVKGENRIPTKTKIEAGQVIEARSYPL